MLEDDPCSEGVDAGDTPAHLGAAVPPARRDLNDLDHTRVGIYEFLDLKGGRLEGSGELAAVAAEPLVAPVDLDEHLARGRHDLSVQRAEGDDLVWDKPAPGVGKAPDHFQPLGRHASTLPPKPSGLHRIGIRVRPARAGGGLVPAFPRSSLRHEAGTLTGSARSVDTPPTSWESSVAAAELPFRGMGPGGDFVGAFSPAHVLGRSEGIAVVFVTAELWTHRLFIRLCAAQNERTRSLGAQWASEFEQFTREVRATRERGDATRPVPPDQPGELLCRVPLVVSDDLGTAYRSTGSSAAGTGTEWRGEWYFEPGVPRDASVLSVRIDRTEGVAGPATYLCEISRCLRFQIDAEHEPAG